MSTRHPGVRDEGSLTKKKEKPGPSATAAQKVIKENSLTGVKAGGLHFLSAGVGLLPIAVVSQLPRVPFRLCPLPHCNQRGQVQVQETVCSVCSFFAL